MFYFNNVGLDKNNLCHSLFNTLVGGVNHHFSTCYLTGQKNIIWLKKATFPSADDGHVNFLSLTVFQLRPPSRFQLISKSSESLHKTEVDPLQVVSKITKKKCQKNTPTLNNFNFCEWQRSFFLQMPTTYFS